MRSLGAIAVVLAAVVAGLVLSAALSGGGQGGSDGSEAALPAPLRGATTFSPRDATADPRRGVTLVAHARAGSIAVYRRPGAARPQRRLVQRTVAHQRLPLVFLVVRRRPGWVGVALPTRPNQSRGWVRERAVRLRRDDYRVEIRLRAHLLIVYEGRRRIRRSRIGVGRAVSPTPTGTYFVTDLFQPHDPHGFYGPYAFGLSAYSPVFTHFAGGDGQVGIHGTNQPTALGTDVSHGCIRVANGVIEVLARRLPLGTPVRIRA